MNNQSKQDTNQQLSIPALIEAMARLKADARLDQILKDYESGSVGLIETLAQALLVVTEPVAPKQTYLHLPLKPTSKKRPRFDGRTGRAYNEPEYEA